MEKFGVSQGVNDASNAASNSYNGLQSKLTKRFSHGLSLLASYTWSKTLDFGGGVGPAIGNQVTRGPAAWDRKHVLSIGHTYELPLGKGHRYLSRLPRAESTCQAGGSSRASLSTNRDGHSLPV